MYRRRAVGLLGMAALFLVAAPVDAGRGGSCEPNGTKTAKFSPAQTTSSLLCLINAQRAERGVHPLRFSPLLRRAARGHAEDLVARRYFSHRTPEGLSSRDRIRRTGFLDGAIAWRTGEVLVYGDAGPQAPEGLHHAINLSGRHRQLILADRFDTIGIGLARGWPVPGRSTPGVTVVVDLGYVARAP